MRTCEYVRRTRKREPRVYETVVQRGPHPGVNGRYVANGAAQNITVADLRNGNWLWSRGE